jgi:hypothetical protein
MSRQQIRANQLITTFGPGSMVDLPDKSIIVAGLDKWNYAKDNHCVVEEPRLAAKLARILRGMSPEFKGQSVELRRPPPTGDAMFQKGQITPGVTGYIFPHWFIVQNVELSLLKNRRRKLILQGQLDQGTGRFKDKGKSYSVVPVRFVRACRKGHVGDIQWRDFVHSGRTLCQQDLWLEERGTTGDLADVWVICDCGATRSMSKAAEPGELGKCNGSRPWLDDSENTCDENNRLLIRTASNAYFSQTLPVISIPDGMTKVEAAVLELWDSHLSNIKSIEDLANIKRLIPVLSEKLSNLPDEAVFQVMQIIQAGNEVTSIAKPVKEVEFEALARADDEDMTDQPDGDFFVRRLNPSNWKHSQLVGINNVVLVHRLREVVALLGFTRLEPESADITGELDMQVQRAPIVRNPRWMPVAENRGEGLFIHFDEQEIQRWANSDPVRQRSRELEDSLQRWREVHPSSAAEFPGVSYIMLHSLSHLLISAISLECGYPMSSLRERIYSPDGKGAMDGRFGILLYTASSGSEGTLGGLVHAARDIRKHFLRALQLGTLCSNDPVCSSGMVRHGGVDRISGSACHGCLYISETSCERFNQFLDRTLVVPTIERRGCEFLRI